jgi:ketosteroid isomerase-like protein
VEAAMVEQNDLFLTRLVSATNAHDVEAVVAMFHDDYVSSMPVHPSRSFRGSEQVRRNWTQIFGAVPDLEARVLQSVRSEDQVWSEWEMSGTRVDGQEHLMRGVLIFTVRDEKAASLLFYLEPVDREQVDTDTSVRQLLER